MQRFCLETVKLQAQPIHVCLATWCRTCRQGSRLS